MSYEKQTWRDTESGGTTITAERLNHMEEGIGSANDAWDSISQVSLTEKTTAKKWGRYVVINMAFEHVTITDSWGSFALGTLPAGMRPPHEVAQPVNVPNGASTTAALFVGTDGAVSVRNYGSAPAGTQDVSCTASWIAV